LPIPDQAEVQVYVGLTDVVADPGEQVERAPVLAVGVLEITEAGQRAGQTAMRVRRTDQVILPVRHSQDRALHGGELQPVPAPLEEGLQRPGQPPGAGVTHAGRPADERGEYRVLDGEPGHGLLLVVHRIDRYAARRPGQVERIPMRVQPQGSGVCGVQVVVAQAAQRRLPVGRRVVPVGKLRRVRAQQVVAGVPTGCGFGHQVCADQAGGGWRTDIRAGIQTDQPEHPRGAGVQGLQ
jgi:hypothetical protein